MFTLFKQIIEDKRKKLQLESKPVKSSEKFNISKQFLEVLQLSFEATLSHSEDKLSKKKGKMKTVEDKIDVLYHKVIDAPSKAKFDDIIALSLSYCNVGLKYSSSKETDHLNIATVYLSRCLELLEGKHLEPKTILTSIRALNELNLICEKMKNKMTSYKFLNKAMELYLKYTFEDNYVDPIDISSVIGIEEKQLHPKLLLDSLHYITLQDMGIQYIAKPKDKHKFVIYVHRILNVRLTEMVLKGKQFDEKCIDWALTLFDLSKYFIANDRFEEAQNHIAVGDYIIYRFFQDKLKTIKKKQKFNYLYESYAYASAVSARSWGSYGVSLLRFWMEKNKKITSNDVNNLISTLEIKSDSNLLIFSELETELECIIDQIKEICILDFSKAKSIFVTTLRHFNTAKEYFTATTDIEAYAKIMLQISEIYKYLAGFEVQRDRQLKLHKRRIECLEEARKKFNKTISTDAELQIYRRIWYEVVISCSIIMDLMLEETYYEETFKEMSVEVKRYAMLISENINLYLDIHSLD